MGAIELLSTPQWKVVEFWNVPPSRMQVFHGGLETDLCTVQCTVRAFGKLVTGSDVQGGGHAFPLPLCLSSCWGWPQQWASANVALFLLILGKRKYFASTVIPACQERFKNILSENDSQCIQNPKWIQRLFPSLAFLFFFFLWYFTYYSPHRPNITWRKFHSAKSHHHFF